MPRALSQSQRIMLVQTLLEPKIPQAEIATRAQCSIGQIKKMARNKRGFGTVVRSKMVTQGRPRTFIREMVEVLSCAGVTEAESLT
jgi:hypothetical protein